MLPAQLGLDLGSSNFKAPTRIHEFYRSAVHGHPQPLRGRRETQSPHRESSPGCDKNQARFRALDKRGDSRGFSVQFGFQQKETGKQLSGSKKK